MLKLIKYEIKTIQKEFFMMIGVAILLNLALLTRINAWGKDVILVLSLLVCFGVAVVAFIYSIFTFSRELKHDTGYLLYTIPKTGYSILGSKLISALIIIFLTVIVGLLMTLFVSFIAFGSYFSKGLNDYFKVSGTWGSLNTIKLILVIVVDLIIVIIGYCGTLLSIYFSAAISKVILNRRKFAGLLSFIIFIIVNLIGGKIYDILFNALPANINPYMKVLNNVNNPEPTVLLIPVNIAGGIFELIFTVGLFIATAYILEKKIDL